MSQKFEKLKTLLKELFQLDQPDLDFGLYRIMHAKSAEVSQFLDKDLLPQVKAAFGAYKSADKAEIEKELAKAVEQAQSLGVDPETTQKVKDLRAKLASEAVDLGQLESEVYDHLFSFFRRYYSEGDFLAKRVYKPGVYAIPYEGEEVTLHWANKDQYYIKTSEYLRDYAFRLRPEIRVTADAPPVCLIHAGDDRITSAGSALVYLEYRKLGLPAELHVYSSGGHGFGMKPGEKPVAKWPDRVADWMRQSGWMP